MFLGLSHVLFNDFFLVLTWARLFHPPVTGNSAEGFQAGEDHKQGQGGTPRYFLWLSDCCNEGPRAVSELVLGN